MRAFLRRDNPAGEHGRPIRTGRPDRPVIHPPSVAVRVAMLGVLTIALVGMIIFRLWFLQVLSGQQFVAAANDNRLRSVKVVAPRGTILDRHGEVIVDNRPGLSVGIRPMDVPGGQMAKVVARLAEVLHMSPADVRRRLVDRAALGDPVLAEFDHGANADDGGGVWQKITAKLGMQSRAAQRAARRQELWQQIVAGASSQYELVVLKEDTTKAVVSYLLEHKQSFPGVEVRQSYLRHYPFGNLAAHLLGYVGPISEAQLAEPQYRKYSPGDVIGEEGVENTYDRWLRGVDGSLRVEVDVAGRPKRVVPGGSLAKPGDNLELSLDVGVQRAAEQAIQYGISLAHANEAPSADAGAAVVLDAHSGEVIAMASYPTYDPDQWVGGISTKDFERLTSRSANDPLLNRADMGLYAIGSTFKPVDAIAALEGGDITPGTVFTCTGTYKPPGALDKKTWSCWDTLGHGPLNLIQALTVSCDIYFYNVGMLFYARPGTPLQDWATRLGFGHTTGLDIPGEKMGVVPTRKWKEQTFTTEVDKIWSMGDSINLAIGQGNLLATPLQTAVAYAAIANGGEIVRPHLGVKIVDAQGHLVQRIDHPAPGKIDIAAQNLAAVRQGLRLAASSVPAGTSSGIFGSYRIPVAGKTGTSEVLVDGHPYDFAWYASYAPADDPRYVVVMMIEKGGHGGAVAAPAARLIYDQLFNVHSGRAVGTVNSD